MGQWIIGKGHGGMANAAIMQRGTGGRGGRENMDMGADECIHNYLITYK